MNHPLLVFGQLSFFRANIFVIKILPCRLFIDASVLGRPSYSCAYCIHQRLKGHKPLVWVTAK